MKKVANQNLLFFLFLLSIITSSIKCYSYENNPEFSKKTIIGSNNRLSDIDKKVITIDFNKIVVPNLISGVVKNGSTTIQGAIVQLVVNWFDSTHPWKSITATTDSQGLYSFADSEIAGYPTISSLKVISSPASSIFYPAVYENFATPSTAQIYNFNTQQVAPQVSITSPSTNTVTIAVGGTVTLTADSSLTYNDGTTTLSTVIFNIGGQNITSTNTSGTIYTGTWTPTIADFNQNHTITVTVTSSTSIVTTATKTILLSCSGGGCPNQLPIITWLEPTQSVINQASGFQPVTVKVTATDQDGSVNNVTISVNGSTYNAMTLVAPNTYSYSFLPTSYTTYPIIIKAIDNIGGTKLFNKSIQISNSIFNALPEKVILGYVHSWENSSAPFLYFNQMGGNKYNVVVYSFIETLNSDGFTPQLTVNEPRYFSGGVYNSQLLKNDIAFLRNQGIPVIVSIGGQNGHVELTTVAKKDTFVAGLRAIVDEYKFDGIDLDFEGGSMNFGAGALTNFSYASISAYPKLKNVIDAFKELKTYYGNGFILTAAPETTYVQGGYSTYAGIHGAFLPVIHNLRNELDLLMVQLYNTGSINALNGTAYSQATPDFLVSMSDMLIKGFNVAATGYHFDGLPASKIIVGIPACPSAAPAGGYITTDQTINALNYLRFGTTFSGRNYTLQAGGPHPNLRGVMTWSINWDATPNCGSAYEFSNAYYPYFYSGLSNTEEHSLDNEINIYLNDSSLIINSAKNNISKVNVYNLYGQLLASYKGNKINSIINIDNNCFLSKQLFIIQVIDDKENQKTFKLIPRS